MKRQDYLKKVKELVGTKFQVNGVGQVFLVGWTDDNDQTQIHWADGSVEHTSYLMHDVVKYFNAGIWTVV